MENHVLPAALDNTVILPRVVVLVVQSTPILLQWDLVNVSTVV